MYKIKQIPEDFIVKEITNVKPQNKGHYSYFLLKKKDYTTLKAIEQIARRLRLPTKYFGFAGSKDKKAVTEQLVSIKNCNIKSLKLKDIELKYFGKGNKPISLGDLEGNEFIVTVRGMGDKKINNKIRIPNYFDEQRFSKNNAEIGEYLIKKNFKKATNLILKNKGDYEENLKEYLKQKPNDYVGALRTINKKLLRLYVHSYQSYIFNETINQYLKLNKKVKNIKIPIMGFGTEIKNKKIKEIIEGILKKENINPRDFILPQIPELSSEGTERDLFIDVKDFKILKKEKDKITLSFTLQKGSYATIVIKTLFEC